MVLRRSGPFGILCCVWVSILLVSPVESIGDEDTLLGGAVDLTGMDDLGNGYPELGELWINTQDPPNVPAVNFSMGSLRIVPGAYFNATANASRLGETNNTNETPVNNARLTTAYYYSNAACTGEAIWTLEAREGCKSEPLTQGGNLRLELCSTKGGTYVLGSDGAKIKLLRDGCHSTELEGVVTKWNNYCRKSRGCVNCSTIPPEYCMAVPTCSKDKEFDAVFYADQYKGNSTEVAAMALNTDKLIEHWVKHGQKNKWLGCAGCCPGKALVPDCAYSAVGCSRERFSEADIEIAQTDLGDLV